MDELLQLLKNNALESPENLAKMLDVSSDEVKRKIAEYEAQGIICGYQAVLNEDQLNVSHVTAIIEVKIMPQREGGFDHVAMRIAKFPEVQSAFLISGTSDLVLFISGKSLKEAASFVSEKLAVIDGVTSTATSFMLKTYKLNGLLMEEENGIERLKVTP